MLPALPIQYADFAVWQRNWLQGEVLEHQLAYWRDKLGGELPVLELPTMARPKIQTHGGRGFAFTLPGQSTAFLKDLERAHGVTSFMSMLAVFKYVLSLYSGHQDVIIGTPVANRNRAEIEPLIGFFVNTLALRTNLSACASFAQTLKAVRTTCLDAYTHQDLPFERLVDELKISRDLGRSPVFQAMFSLDIVPNDEGEIAESQAIEDIGYQLAKFDISLSMTQSDQAVKGLLVYNTDLFEPAIIHGLAHCIRQLAMFALEHPEEDLSRVSLLTPGQMSQLERWSTAAHDWDEELTIVDRFTQVVSRHAQRPARGFRAGRAA